MQGACNARKRAMMTMPSDEFVVVADSLPQVQPDESLEQNWTADGEDAAEPG